MICPFCKRDNVDTALFCAYCGASLSGEVAAVEEYDEVAVLAAEITGISTITSKYPRSIISALVDECMDAFGRIIDNFGGTITRRFSVGIEADFGATTIRENDTELAALSALNIIDDINIIVRNNLVDKNDNLPVRCCIDFGEISIRRSSGITSLSADGLPVNTVNLLTNLTPDNSILLTELARQRIDLFFTSEPVIGAAIMGRYDGKVYLLGKRKTGITTLSDSYPGKLFGRNDEVTELRSFFDGALKGNEAVCIVAGESGIGKSSVIKKALEDFGDEDIFWTRCFPKGGDLSFMPFRQFLSNLFDAKPGVTLINAAHSYLSDVNSELRRYVPLLDILYARRVIDNEYTEVLTPSDRYQRLIKLVHEIIKIYSSGRPVVIVFEDAQWLDSSSKRLISDLNELITGLPIAFVISTRSPGKGLTIVNSRLIGLKPLPDNDIEAIVKEFAPVNMRDDKRVKEIVESTGGNPQDALEYFRGIESGEDGVDLDVPRPVKTTPQSVLESLSQNAKSLLTYCLYTDTPVKAIIVKESMGIEDSEFEVTLKEVASPGIIEISGDFISFKAGSFKEAFHSSQPESTELDILIKIADTAIKIGEEPEFIAGYLEQCGRLSEAAQYWIKAGDVASVSQNQNISLGYYERAFGLTDTTDLSVDTKVDILNKLLRVYRMVGDYEKAFDILNEEVEHGKSPAELGNYFKQTANIYFDKSEFVKAISSYNDSLMIYRHIDDDEQIGYCYLKLSQSYYYNGDFGKSEEFARLITENRDTDFDNSMIAGACNQIALVNIALFDYKESLDYSRKAYSIWEEDENEIGLNTVYANIGLSLLNLGLVNRSKDFIEQSYINAQNLGRVPHIIYTGSIYVLLHLYSANYDEGFKLIGLLDELATKSGNVLGQIYIKSVASRFKRFLGYFDDAADLAEKSNELGSVYGDPVTKIDCLYNLAISELYRGNYENIEKHIGRFSNIVTRFENIENYKNILAKIIEGELALRRGEIDKLSRVTESLVKLTEGIGDARRCEIGISIARFYRGLGQTENAIETAKPIAGWAKNNGFTLARLLSSTILCELYSENDKIDEAVYFYRYINSVLEADAGRYWRDWFAEYSDKF